MADVRYSTSYTNCMHSILITGLPEGKTEDELLHSFVCIMRNIFCRGRIVKASSFLQGQLGEVEDIAEPLPFVWRKAQLPHWENTIKGTESGYNPARDFYYSDKIWKQFVPGYEWVRQLMIPEAGIDDILEDYSLLWKDQAVDFYLPIAKLVIEIDGEQHQTDPDQAMLDKFRDEVLLRHQIQTIRIPVCALREQNDTFCKLMESLRNIIEHSEKIQIIKQHRKSNNATLRARYERILRYQFLLLELLDRDVLRFESKKWELCVSSEDQADFLLASQDLFIWFRNLYQLKGLPFDAPDIRINSESSLLELQNHLLRRQDEREDTCPTVYNSLWDDSDFYRVSSAVPVNYMTTWPSAEDGPQCSALKYFLFELFGYKKLNPGQWQIITNLLCLQKTIGVLPTGGGKSLCYQLAAMLQPGLTLVTCPIISLQIDQKRNLDKVGITHTQFISSLQEANEKAEIIEAFRRGKYQIIWISPERFQIRAFRAAVGSISQTQTIAYNIIDEVHCLSEWGHDFRTSYLTLISTLEKTCPSTPIIGLTATASKAVLDDLKAEFNIDGNSIRALPSLKRENLTFRVIQTEEKNAELKRILQEHHYGEPGATPDSGLIFTLIRDQSDEPPKFPRNLLAKTIRDTFPNQKELVGIYHSKIIDKVEVQNNFLDGNLRLLSTTKAFGMGINKTDLQFTIHYNLPWSVEAFYQEAGRAGRDPEIVSNADCTILYSPDAFGKKEAISEVFKQETQPEAIKRLVDQKDIRGDLGTIFYLWGGNNKGVETDLYMIRTLLERIHSSPQTTEDGKTYYSVASEFPVVKDDNAEHPKRLTKDRLELALYRLKLLGFVEDWMVNWNVKPPSFDVYLNPEHDQRHIYERLQAYFMKYRTADTIAPYDAEGDEPDGYILYYAKELIQWTYKNIIFSRRAATEQIRRLCEKYTDPDAFRRDIDDYLRISEQTITLDGIISAPNNYDLWFRAFYGSDISLDWNRTDYLLTPAGIRQLRLASAHYRESYREITGLNVVYSLSGMISDYADLDVETDLLSHCFENINKNMPEAQEDIWRRLIILIEHYGPGLKEQMREGLGYCLVRGFPDKSREIHQVLHDKQSLSYIIQEATQKIQNAAAAIRR